MKDGIIAETAPIRAVAGSRPFFKALPGRGDKQQFGIILLKDLLF